VVSVAEPLSDLRQRWAEEARERAELDAVIDLEDLDPDDDEPVADDEEPPVDRDAAMRALRHEADDDQPWRRS
jgi:hypothetical protein